MKNEYNKNVTKGKSEAQSIEMKFNIFEAFYDNPNAIDSSNYNNDNEKTKYKNKLKLSIIETLLFENGQPIAWMFTDKNGYVMRKSQKKLTKDFIIKYFIGVLRKHTNKLLVNITDEQIITDLNKFSTLIDQKNFSKNVLFGEKSVNYLLTVDKIKFLLLNKVEDNKCSYMFVNLIEFYKLMNENVKINNINLVQNFIDVQCMKGNKDENDFFLSKEKLRLLMVKYVKEKPLSQEKIFLYLNKPKVLTFIDCSVLENKKKRILCKTMKNFERRNSLSEMPKLFSQKEEIENELIMINNENLNTMMRNLIINFVKFVEKKKFCSIKECFFTFIKTKQNEDYCFQFCELMLGDNMIEQEDNEIFNTSKTNGAPKKTLNDIIKQKVPKDVKKFKKYEKITAKAFCFGEFCDYKIPATFKNLKKNSKIEETNKNIKIPNENRFTNRDKDHNLPYFLPVFQIKRAYDNPQLVNIVLKAYSIFPKNFDKDEEINRILKERKELEEKKKKLNEEGSISSSFSESQVRTVSLYTPTPKKFSHINYDEMYIEKNICENCFKIYSLIDNFLSQIDENSNQFVSFAKAKDILLRGENLKSNAYYDEPGTLNLEDNLLFQEEVNELSLKKILKKNIQRENELKMNQNAKNTKKVKLYRNGRTFNDDMNKIFSYDIPINPKLLKLNLVAEKSQNKFFKLIFNELRSEPENVYKKLCLGQKDLNRGPKLTSMKYLRMHMGINSHNPKYDFTTKNNKKNTKYENENAIRETNVVDSDIFLIYKNLIKTEENHNFIRNVKTTNVIEGSDRKVNSSEEKSMDEIESSSEDLNFSENNNEVDEIILDQRRESNVSSNRMKSYSRRSQKRQKTVKIPRQRSQVIGHRRSISSKEVPILSSNDIFPRKKGEITEEEKHKKLEQFLHISPKHLRNESQMDIDVTELEKVPEFVLEPKPMNSDSHTELPVPIKKKDIEKEKKIQLTSIYYDKNYEMKNSLQYYYTTTPFPKFNEGNIPIVENPLLLTQKMTTTQYISIGKFKASSLILGAKIFVYDSNTAIPYEILDIKSSNGSKNKSKGMKTLKRSLSLLESDGTPKLLFVVINDFFDSYDKYRDIVFDAIYEQSSNISEAKCVFFNLPGQSSTMFSKARTLNNVFYAEFLDRFLFYLFSIRVFDQTYKVVFVGFGNGGQIALTYASCYERYWDFIHTIIMFNGYCENDGFINQSMVELLKIVQKSKNPKMVEFFVKSLTVDPQTLIELRYDKRNNTRINSNLYNSESGSDESSNDESQDNEKDPNLMTMIGYKNITKGYFFNQKINHKTIKTKIIAVHSNQNCFISINNLNALFMNQINSYSVTGDKHIPRPKKINENEKNESQKLGKNKTKLPNITTTSETEGNRYFLTSTNRETTKTQFTNNIKNTNNNNNNKKTASSSSEYEFTELKKDSDLKRKLIVVDGSHDFTVNSSSIVQRVLGSYLKYIIDNNMLLNS